MEIVLFKITPREGHDAAAYESTFGEMLEAVAEIDGFVSIEGFAGEDGSELAVARFETADAIRAWRDHAAHVGARDRGRREFFSAYEITIATVSRTYDWSHARDGDQPPDGVA